MNKFFETLLTVLAWAFLAVSIIALFILLSLNNGEMTTMWGVYAGAILSSLFLSAVSWVMKTVLSYINQKSEDSQPQSYEE